MKKIASTCKALWSDESAQGMTEYILLLVVVVGLVMVFGKSIKQMINDKMGSLSTDVGSITSQ